MVSGASRPSGQGAGGIMDIIADLGRWLAGLEPAFAFLLALPFVVAAAGLLAFRFESRGKRREQRERRSAAIARASGRPAHVR
jgi:hypothetical protein